MGEDVAAVAVVWVAPATVPTAEGGRGGRPGREEEEEEEREEGGTCCCSEGNSIPSPLRCCASLME